MTTLAPELRTQRLAEIDRSRKDAWASYMESVQELKGRDYEETEGESWERLQERLRELDDERELVEGG